MNLPLPTSALIMMIFASPIIAQQQLPKANDLFTHRPGQFIPLNGNPGFEIGGMLSADGRYLYSQLRKDKSDTLIAYDFQNGAIAQRYGKVGQVRGVRGPRSLSVALSPKEKAVAVGDWAAGEGAVSIYDALTGKQLSTFTAEKNSGGKLPAMALQFSPDGETLYVVAVFSGEIVAWNVAAAKERWRIPPPAGRDAPYPRVVAPATDGKRLIAAGAKGYFRILDSANCAEVKKLDVENVVQNSRDTSFDEVHVSTNGMRAVFCDVSRGIWHADLSRGQVQQVFRTSANSGIEGLAMAPSGSFILFSDLGEKHKAIRLVQLDGTQPPTINLNGIPGFLASSSSGDRVLLRVGTSLVQYCLPRK